MDPISASEHRVWFVQLDSLQLADSFRDAGRQLDNLRSYLTGVHFIFLNSLFMAIQP
jgi:hypothetical protein